ncbi:hypothetical protein Tco_1314848 [Tanacetum coccineum]
MTLKLANRSVTFPMGIAEDVIVKVENFNFIADFVIVDFEADPRMISGNPTPSSDSVVESPSPSPIPTPFHSHIDDSFPEYETFCFRDEQKNQRTGSEPRTKPELIRTKPEPEPSVPVPVLDFEIFSVLVPPVLDPCSSLFCFDMEEKSSGSTTTHSDYSLLDYDAFYFDDDHIEEKSSGSTTTHSDFSLLSAFYHEEFADELAHIISPLEYDYFSFDLEGDPGEFTRVLEENIFNLSTKGLTINELKDSSILVLPIVTPSLF